MKKRILSAILMLWMISTFSVMGITLDTVETANLSSFEDDGVAYLAAENYGVLIGSQNFESSNALKEKPITPGSSVYAFGSGAETSLATPSGISGASQMLRIYSPGKTGPAAGYTNMTLSDAGTYTITFDYYIPSDYTFGWFKVVNNIADVTINPKKGSIQSAVAQIVVPNGKTLTQYKFQIYNYGATMTNSFYIDNIKVYYLAPAACDITVYTDAKKTNIFKSQSKVKEQQTFTLPTKEEFAEYIPQGKYLNAFVVGKEVYPAGAVYTVNANDAKTGTLDIIPYISEKHGTLFFLEEYNDIGFSSRKIPVTRFGLGSADSSNVYNRGSGTSFSIGTPIGITESMMKVTPTTGTSNSAAYVNAVITTEGFYTLTFDYYIPTDIVSSGTSAYRLIVGSNKSEISINKANLAVGRVGSLEYTYTIEPESRDTLTLFYTNLYYNGGGKITGPYYIDNLKLFYEEIDYVTVKVYADNNKNVLFDEIKTRVGAKVQLPTCTEFSDVTPKGHYLKSFVIDNKEYKPGTIYNAEKVDTETIDVVPVFEKPYTEYGDALVFEQFESAENGFIIFNNKTYGGTMDTSVNTYYAVPNVSDDENFADKDFCINRGSNAHTSFITEVDGNKVIEINQNNSSTASDTTYINTYPQIGICGGASADTSSMSLDMVGKYTVCADFYVPSEYLAQIKNLCIRINSSTGEHTEIYTDISEGWNNVCAELFNGNDTVINSVYLYAETVQANSVVKFYIDNIAVLYTGEVLSFTDGEKTLYSEFFVPDRPFVLPSRELLDIDYEPYYTIDGKDFYAGNKVVIGAENTEIIVKELIAPISIEKVAFRLTGEKGIRVAAFVPQEIKAISSEYGYIISADKYFEKDENDIPDYSALVFPEGYDTSSGEGILENNGNPFINGIAYSVSKCIDLVYSTTGSVFGNDVTLENNYADGGIYYTGVLMGIEGFEELHTTFATRPYIKIDQQYFYGKPFTCNMYDLAVRYQNTYGRGENDMADSIVECGPNYPYNGSDVITCTSPINNATVSLASSVVQNWLDTYTYKSAINNFYDGRNNYHSPGITFSWNCEENAEKYVLRYATQPDFSDAYIIETTNTSYTAFDLFVGTRYYWSITAVLEEDTLFSDVLTFTTEQTPRAISLESVSNTRDIGGYVTEDGTQRVKQAMVYRGAQLDQKNYEITAAGIKKARDVYGIRAELDLREEPSEGNKSILGDDIIYYNISGISYYGGDRNYLNETARIDLGKEIKLFADVNNYPFYFHCAGGRDRTGCLAFIIGGLLGVSEHDLVKDYEMTWLSIHGGSDTFSMMEGFINHIKSYSGNSLKEKTANFCFDLGVTEDEISAIRSILLEDIE